MKIDFCILDSARMRRGQTIQEVCLILGVSWQTWNAWRGRARGVEWGTITVHEATGRAVKEYIRRRPEEAREDV